VRQVFAGEVYRVEWHQEFGDPPNCTYIVMGQTLYAKDELEAYQKVSKHLLSLRTKEEWV
jgi:hypothetical protein